MGKTVNENLIKIKAELLCKGLQVSEAAQDIYMLQHPTEHKRTGNGGIHIRLGNLVISATYGESFCKGSPFKIEKINGKFYLLRGSEQVSEIQVIKAPDWYMRRTSGGEYMSDVMLKEGRDTLITAVWSDCAYFNEGTQCKFCILGYEKGLKWKSLDNVVETVGSALDENPEYYVHLTGGNTLTPDRGFKYYQRYIEAVGNKFSPKLSIEVSPPEDLGDLDRAVEAGLKGFASNFEIWNEDRRRKICPAKGQIPREQYFKMWERGVELLGPFAVSSLVICGLDEPEELAKGIRFMARMGVRPAIIPFRPFDQSELNGLNPPQYDELIGLSEIIGDELRKAGAKEEQFYGCEHCGACTVGKDCFKYSG